VDFACLFVNANKETRGLVGSPTQMAIFTKIVRFPDGFAILLTREEFDVLKHFKDRFLGPASASTDFPEFDLDQFVIYASKQNADGCWPSSAASYRGTRRKHGAWSCTAILIVHSSRRLCPKGRTMKR
jgi:hypothetical protein